MKNLLALLITLATYLPAVTGQYFTTEDIEVGIKSYLQPATIKNLQWLGTTDRLLYSSDTAVFIMNIAGDTLTELVGLNEMNKILFMTDGLNTPAIPEITALSDSEICFRADEHLVIYKLGKKKAAYFVIPDTAANIHISPDRNRVACTLGNNVFLLDRSGTVLQITHDSLDGIKNGDAVYRNEFGMETGLFWSPAGNYLAYYRKDERGVSKYPMVDIEARVAAYKPVRYPMAGMKSEETDIFVYNIKSKSGVKLQITGDPEQYSTNLSWTPDEQHICLQHLNRGQDTMTMKSYSSATGELETVLFTETNPKYVEPEHPVVFSGKIKGDFFYQSERDGYNHLYYYSAKAKKLVRLTSGNWDVTGFSGTDETEKKIYFTATLDSPLENNLYELDRKTNEIKRLTNTPGTHEVKFNRKTTCFIDDYSGTTLPHVIALNDSHGKVIRRLIGAENPVLHYELGETSTGTLLAADDASGLYYRLVKPVRFDASKKYPLVVYLYGGPHLQLITDSWLDRTDYFQQYLAQHGIASFMLDTRGSDRRGRAFEDVIFRQSGIPQMEDQMKGIEFLRSLPWVDTTRLGIHGWSYGGFMTLTMMVNYPGVFKVGVAGGPVTDWKYYEVMYGERYMDRPEENPEGYEKTSVLNKAGNLSGKLLIIHGGIDPVVVPQNSLLFLQECIKNGKQVNYFVYPEHEHNVAGKDRVHLATMITGYFIDNL